MTQDNEISKNSLLAHYHGELQQKLQGKVGPFLYRGQERPESVWPLQSGAAQRIRESKGIEIGHPTYLEELIEYHERLIETVRRKRWYMNSGKDEPSDLEILAILQHNGAATCLLDFTTRFDTALWFACRGKDEKDGTVFVVGISHYDPMPREITAQEIQDKKPIADILKSCVTAKTSPVPQFSHWDPEVLMGRMLSQNSQFLFGPRDIPKGGFLESIKIEGKHSKDLLEELKRQQGLRSDTIFADIHGFADANARDIPLPKRDAGDYFRSGRAKSDKGDFDGAIADYNEAIRLKPDYAIAWNNRGFVKRRKDDLDGAIADYNEAIRLRPNYEEAIQNREIAQTELQKITKTDEST